MFQEQAIEEPTFVKPPITMNASHVDDETRRGKAHTLREQGE